jgi:hypothetical protein
MLVGNAHSRRRRVGAVAVVVAGIGATGAGVALSSTGVPLRASPGLMPTPNTSHSPSVASAFAVFRKATVTRAAIAFPALPSGVPRPVIVNKFGLQLANTRYETVGTSVHVWLIPGSSGACMLWQEALAPGVGGIGSVCTDQTHVDAGLLNAQDEVTPGSTDKTLFGLVPDGNTQVAVTLADGTTTSVPVTDNFFATTGSAAAPSMTIKTSSGTAAKIPTVFGPAS